MITYLLSSQKESIVIGYRYKKTEEEVITYLFSSQKEGRKKGEDKNLL